MKIELWLIGKTKDEYLKSGISVFVKRLKHYCSFQIIEIPLQKKAIHNEPKLQKQSESYLIHQRLIPGDYLILMDERGKELRSKEFADLISNFMIQGKKKIVFLVGGAYGFDHEVYKKADLKISMSKMTFSHQMIRLFFVEQLYRAFTIIKNEKYHNE